MLYLINNDKGKCTKSNHIYFNLYITTIYYVSPLTLIFTSHVVMRHMMPSDIHLSRLWVHPTHHKGKTFVLQYVGMAWPVLAP